MRYEYGIAALVALISGFVVWHRTKKTASSVAVVPNVVTENAGSDVPSVPLSNSPSNPADNDWFPYYLTANYPADRGGHNVIPSTVVGAPNWMYGPQETIPSL